MSDTTKQAVYEAAKRWVADAEQPLDELIEAIKAHRTDEASQSVPEPAADPTTPAEPEPTV